MQNQRGIFSVVKNVRNWEELKSLLFFYVKKLHEKVQVFNLDNEINFDYNYYEGIKGKWYECDNYWVSEKFYEKNKEPYWFYDSCSPSEYEGEDKE